MRVFITGQKWFAAELLRRCLNRGHDVVGVAPPPTPGRPDRLALAAEEAGIPVHGAAEATAIAKTGADVLVAAHAHGFISEAARGAARYGALGYHPSLLPLHRGRDAIRWAIRDGDRVTGGTVYWLSDVIDGGPVAAQDWCFIRPDDTAEELRRRELAPMGHRLVLDVLDQLNRGHVAAEPQDEALATWEPAFERPPLRRVGRG